MNVHDVLVREIGLTELQARVYLAVTTRGRMDCAAMARNLSVSEDLARSAAASLVGLGSFIEYGAAEYEATHPRFAAVNMYRRACQRRNIPFGRNRDVDNAGAALERQYEDARTK